MKPIIVVREANHDIGDHLAVEHRGLIRHVNAVDVLLDHSDEADSLVPDELVRRVDLEGAGSDGTSSRLLIEDKICCICNVYLELAEEEESKHNHHIIVFDTSPTGLAIRDDVFSNGVDQQYDPYEHDGDGVQEPQYSVHEDQLGSGVQHAATLFEYGEEDEEDVDEHHRHNNDDHDSTPTHLRHHGQHGDGVEQVLDDVHGRHPGDDPLGSEHETALVALLHLFHVAVGADWVLYLFTRFGSLRS